MFCRGVVYKMSVGAGHFVITPFPTRCCSPNTFISGLYVSRPRSHLCCYRHHAPRCAGPGAGTMIHIRNLRPWAGPVLRQELRRAGERPNIHKRPQNRRAFRNMRAAHSHKCITARAPGPNHIFSKGAQNGRRGRTAQLRPPY